MKKIFSLGAEAGAASPTRGSSWKSVRLLTVYFKRYARRLSLGILTLIAVDFLQLVIPRIIKYAVDELQHGTATPSTMLRYGGIIVVLSVVIAAMRYAWRTLLLGFSRLLEADLRSRLVHHILGLDRSFFQRTTTGEIMALATNDLSAVQLATGMGLVASIDAVFMGIAAFAFMAYIHPMLTVIAIAPMPILALLTRLLSARLHVRFRRVQEQFSSLTEFVRSAFASIRLLKAYNQESSQAARFDRMGEAYVQDNLRLAMIYGTLFPISGLVGNASMLIVLFVGGRMAIEGAITTGDFVAFISYLYLMTWPMMALGWVSDLFQRGATSLGRIHALLLEKPELRTVEMPPEMPIREGSIRLRNLSFSYPNQNRAPALHNIQLDIAPGMFLGIVGRTGAGKTTLCHLLARLYPVDDGTVFYDGRDINALPLAGVRGAIAYVPQDVILFSDTIAFNLTMGKPNASQEEIESAARAAAIHDEIVAMKDGYLTRIGERGIRLSGGQRQRLAIARALLLNRPIIIIDDGLSAVDMETEHAIILSIASYRKGHTCIIVSHRVAPLMDAHEIVVMEQGRIVAQGAHDQLLEQSPFYRTIHRQQTMLT